ncbi:MAG TPA: glycosyltransferase family 39 protein [Rhodopila sp.]|nr:glycosyltransferase family 39 protein [Rhodopila sp.]
MTRSPILRLIAATTLIRLIFAATTGLGVDESYMVTAGRVLSLGYFDHPPASWWLSWGAAHLFGSEAPVVVRLPFILLFALSQLLMARITLRIAGEAAAFWAVCAFNLSPVFSVTTGIWVLPDGPLDTTLLGAVLCLLHAVPAQPRRSWGWWTGAGLCAGLALFSKYSAVLTIAGAFLFLVSSPLYRYWLRRPQPYVAGLLALAVFSPVPLWNALHGWASFAFQGDRAAGLRLRPLAPFATWGGEALFVLPWLWVPMMALFVRAFRPGAAWQARMLAWLGAPPIVLFALIAAWSSQKILFHWAAPGYLMLFPLLGAAIAEREHRRWIRRTLAGTAVLILVAVTVIAAQIQFDILGSRLATLMRKDPTAEGLDWTSIRTDLASRGLLPPGAVVAALDWRDAGKIGYGLGPNVTMLCLNSDARQFQFADPPRRFAGRDVLVLALYPPERTRQIAAPWFRRTERLPDTAVRLDGRTLQIITVLRGESLIPNSR